MSEFEKAFNITIKNEGGFSNDKDDPGGATQYGITEKTLREYDPSLNIRQISLNTAKHIYKTNYWIKAHCDEISNLNSTLALLIFDSSVNIGVNTASKLLQKTINTLYYDKLTVDGLIGPKTLSALKFCLDLSAKNLIDVYTTLWKSHYITLISNNSKLKKFINGWLNRVRKTCSQVNY